MRSVWSAALLTCCVAPAAAQSAERDTLQWMTGRWIGNVGEAVAEEHWSESAAGAKMGMFRWIEAGRVAVYEFLIIRREGEDLVLRFKHFDAGLGAREDKEQMVVLRAVKIGAREVVFERAEPGLRVTYRLEADDRLVSVLEQGVGAQLRQNVFAFRRAAR